MSAGRHAVPRAAHTPQEPAHTSEIKLQVSQTFGKMIHVRFLTQPRHDPRRCSRTTKSKSAPTALGSWATAQAMLQLAASPSSGLCPSMAMIHEFIELSSLRPESFGSSRALFCSSRASAIASSMVRQAGGGGGTPRGSRRQLRHRRQSAVLADSFRPSFGHVPFARNVACAPIQEVGM